MVLKNLRDHVGHGGVDESMVTPAERELAGAPVKNKLKHESPQL